MGVKLRRLLWRLHGRLYHRTAPLFSHAIPTEPDVHIPLEMHGNGNCAYAVSPYGLSRRSVAYSFGVGSEISFDLSLIERFGLELHAFDPTDQAAKFVSGDHLPDRFHFHQWALANADGPTRFYGLGVASPFYLPGTIMGAPGSQATTVEGFRLESIMQRLGHDYIDVLKLDVEGAEFPLIESLNGTPPPAGQILLEFHPHIANLERHRVMIGGLGWRRMRAAIAALRNTGYELFHVSERRTEFSFRRG